MIAATDGLVYAIVAAFFVVVLLYAIGGWRDR